MIAALQALRGVAQMTAATIVAETGSLGRFHSPRQSTSYSALVSSEYSSGNRIQRGGITKTGNAHLRRVTVKAAWAYRDKPWVGGFLLKRQQGLDQEIKDIPIARELLGFAWAISVKSSHNAAASCLRKRFVRFSSSTGGR